MPPEVCDSATLGKLKLEHTFKEGLFVLPKIYYLELDNDSVVTKCKGYPGKLSKDQYLELLKGKSINLPVTKWLRSLKNSTIQIKRNMPYVINPLFNKRQKVFDSSGAWVNSTPIILP